MCVLDIDNLIGTTGTIGTTGIRRVRYHFRFLAYFFSKAKYFHKGAAIMA